MEKETAVTEELMPMGQVRDKLRELEVGVRTLKGKKAKVLELLALRSQLEKAVGGHEDAGHDVRAERTRLETVDNALTREAATIAREADAAGGLAKAREGRRPPEEHWWWWLDRQVAEARRKKLTRLGVTVGSIVAVALIVGLVFSLIGGQSGAEKRAYSHTSSGEQAMRNGDYEAAIAEYEQAVELLPSLDSAHIALGVLYEIQGRAEDSGKALAKARELIGNEADYEMALARSYQTAGLLDKALTHAQRSVELAPNSGQAYLVRAGIYEQSGDKPKALADLERAATLAQENGQAELAAMAKMRLGMLSQQVAGDLFSGGVVTATATTTP